MSKADKRGIPPIYPGHHGLCSAAPKREAHINAVAANFAEATAEIAAAVKRKTSRRC